MKLIDKDKVVAEIERRKANIKGYCVREGHDRRFDVVPEQLAHILSFLATLDTIEVKIWNPRFNLGWEEKSLLPINHDEKFTTIANIAKYFFEHGLKAKDVNEIIKTAEDHAYFAGSENTREKLIDKACEWLSQTDFCHYYNKEFIDAFRKAMEE